MPQLLVSSPGQRGVRPMCEGAPARGSLQSTGRPKEAPRTAPPARTTGRRAPDQACKSWPRKGWDWQEQVASEKPTVRGTAAATRSGAQDRNQTNKPSAAPALRTQVQHSALSSSTQHSAPVLEECGTLVIQLRTHPDPRGWVSIIDLSPWQSLFPNTVLF